jgi:hypothetical protein
MMTRKILVTSLTALALSLMTSAMVMAQTTTTGTTTTTTTSSSSPPSNIQGCGNSGMPGCPPKECPPGHGGTNPAGNADCKTQKSGS